VGGGYTMITDPGFWVIWAFNFGIIAQLYVGALALGDEKEFVSDWMIWANIVALAVCPFLKGG
jgi:hypothetical protein